jgi:hypothetical protein
MTVGQSSTFQAFQSTPPSGGFLIYYKAQTPVSDAVMQRDLPNFTAGVREQRQMAAFSLWMSKELQMHVEKAPDKKSAGEAPTSSR